MITHTFDPSTKRLSQVALKSHSWATQDLFWEKQAVMKGAQPFEKKTIKLDISSKRIGEKSDKKNPYSNLKWRREAGIKHRKQIQG